MPKLRRRPEPQVKGYDEVMEPRHTSYQFVTVTDGAWPFQLAISDETFAPELKSTRSHCGPDHVCTE